MESFIKSDFLRDWTSTHRPTSHFIAPHSWSNDPCGAVWVPETKEYLICYQWNPGTSEGGNSAWGMAKSKDLVSWKDCSPPIRNGVSYDRLGVFSGSIVSRLIDGRRVLFLYYTSVSALPIHWSKDYIQGCESQSVACSTDFGTSWHRYEHNPLLTVPPKKAATTGWRDPFVSKWEGLSALLGNDPSTDYMMIASGQRGEGPQLHIYQSHNLLDWKALSTPFLSVRANSTVSPTSNIRFGVNFECASFFSILDRHYIIIGMEEDSSSKRHCGRCLVWLSGNLVLENGRPKFEITSHGLLDHGISYAAHIFRDSEGRLLQLGWADETAKKDVILKQGWAGCLAHPRELYEVSRPAIEVTKNSDLWTVDEASGMMTTLAIRPASQVQRLRETARSISLNNFPTIQSKNFEFQATFRHIVGNEKLTFSVRESLNSREVTKIIFDLEQSLVVVDRSRTSLEKLGTDSLESGSFELLLEEDLHIHVFVDNSILEVFANDRFALTSRIYPSLETSLGASYDLGGFEEQNVTFQCWEGLANAWPHREEKGSSLLEPKYEIMDEKMSMRVTESILEGHVYA